MNHNAHPAPPASAGSAALEQLPEDAPTIRNWIGSPVVSLDASPRPQSGQSAAERLQRAIDLLPVVGQSFAGFELVAVLGRGTFGRVYLARQDELSDRYVALKISTNVTGESRTLARLQHTNIVPVYSVHRVDGFQAVCMPYFGAATLSHLLARYRGRAELPSTGRQLVDTLCLMNDETDVAPTVQPPAAQVRETAEWTHGAGQDAESISRRAERPRTRGFLALIQGMTYTDAVCWIGAQLADGLAHAHSLGVVHNDVKPANVLMTDAGQPMLLDFGVADDLAHRAMVRSIGGTLAYMSPEHIESTITLVPVTDPRSDIYGLGLVLYEMLTGRHAFSLPPSLGDDEVARMLAERRGGAPRIRPHNPAVSPGLEAVIRKCLEPDPARRYQSAADLREDLERHRSHRPLKHVRVPSIRERICKWARRHPRISSNLSIAIVACVVIGLLAAGLVARDASINRYRNDAAARALLDEADNASRGLESDLISARYLLNFRADDPDQIQTGIGQCKNALARYGLPGDEAWENRPAFRALPADEQQHVRDRLMEACLLLARGHGLRANPGENEAQQLQQAFQMNRLAEVVVGESAPSAVWEQRASILRRRGNISEAERAATLAATAPQRTAEDYFLSGSEALASGRYTDAVELLKRSIKLDPASYRAHMALGACYDRLTKYADSAACFTTAIALKPKVWWAYYHRGLEGLKQGSYEQASADLDRAIALEPKRHEIYLHRAIAAQNLQKYPGAIEDLERSLMLGAPKARVLSMRARVHELAGNNDLAKKDLDEAMKLEATDELTCVSRGLARLNVDPAGALKDFDAAIAINPRSLSALQNKSHVLSKVGRTEDAIKTLDRTLEYYPEYVKALSGRGMMRARAGLWDKAKADAEATLRLDQSPQYVYFVAGIYAQLSRHDEAHRARALGLLGSALRGGFGHEYIQSDKDLDPIRETAEFKRILGGVQALKGQ